MLTFGIIGTNFISERFLQAVSQVSEAQVTAIYSRTPETGQAFAKKHSISIVETDFQAFCNSEAFDCVYIASPNICHSSQAIALLNCGKHVLCEKPIATDTASFMAMKEASFKNHRILMEAMRTAYDPAYTVLRRELPKIGKLRRVRLEFCQYSSLYDQYQNGVVLNAFNPKLGNAAVMDIGVYCIYLMLDLFGRPDHIQSSSLLLENGMEGTGTILMHYPNMIGEIVYSKITNSVLPSLFQGENGSITLAPMEQPQQMILYPRNGSPSTIYEAQKDNHMRYELLAFLELVKNQQTKHRSLKLSEDTMMILDQVRAQNNICFS